MSNQKNEYKRLSGGKPEHIEIAEKNIGRKLGKFECVHHKDEDKTNNDPNNLMVMRTYKDHSLMHGKLPVEIFKTADSSYVVVKTQIPCQCCNRLFEPENSRSKYCSMECYLIKKSERIPSFEELKQLVWSKPTTHLSVELGVSDSAIGKWCKKLGIKKPSPGYWTKLKFQNNE